MARYTRDEIITIGLDLAHSSTLDQHDRKGGVIDSNAYSVKWLQQALDMYHSRYPFSGDVTSAAIVIAINNDVVTLPDDFMLDARNGLLVNFSSGVQRLARLSFQRWLDIYNPSIGKPQTVPSVYSIFGEAIHIAPLTSVSYSGTLWYFAQPSLLEASDYPKFPDEWVLVEYIRIKALEWIKQYAPGTASGYMQKELGRMKQAGLLNEPEYDVFPLENTPLADRGVSNRNDWMGSIAI